MPETNGRNGNVPIEITSVADPATVEPFVITQDVVDGLSEIGVSGLNRSSGFVYEEMLSELKGERGRKQVRLMIDEDPIIGAFLYMLEVLCRQVVWRVEPSGDSNEEEADAKFLEECLFEDMSHTWQDTLSEILTFLPWGFQYSEIVYKRRHGPSPGSVKNAQGIEVPLPESKFNDGLVGFRKISPRAQETLLRWIFDDSGGIQSMVQMAPPNYKVVAIPIEKSLLFRTTSRKGNPEGRSILRNAYSSFVYKRNIQRIEAIGIERDLAGLPVAWIPPQYLSVNATAEQRSLASALKEIVTNVRRDEQEGLLLPLMYDQRGNKMFDFALLNSGGTRVFDTSAVVQRYDQRMAASVMAEFILLGMDRVGSFALASSKTNLFAIGVGTHLDNICDVFNRHAIKRLFALNGKIRDIYPKLVHGDIENAPLDELAAWFTALVGAGFALFPSTDGKLEEHVLKMAGLPTVSAEDYVAKAEEEKKAQEEQFAQQVELEKEKVAVGAARVAPKAVGAGAGAGAPASNGKGPAPKSNGKVAK